MRILFTFAGGTGHFLPLVPVARAAERAGHVVAFAGQDGMVATIEAAGFTAFASGGASLLFGRRAGAAARGRPGARSPCHPQHVRGSDRPRARRFDPGGLRGVVPDILVRDEIDFGSAVAAERLGAAPRNRPLHRERLVRPEQPCRRAAERPPSSARAFADPGLAMLDRYLVLSPFPASFRDPTFPPSPNTHLFRSVSSRRSQRTRSRRIGSGNPGRPCRVPDARDDLQPGVRRSVRACARRVARVARERRRHRRTQLDPQILGPQPSNVLVRQYVPSRSSSLVATSSSRTEGREA